MAAGFERQHYELKNEMDIDTAFRYGISNDVVRELYDFKENA